MLRLRTLGSFGVIDASGRAISFPPHRLALLALLAASGDRGMARDRILACLWPESTAAKARAALEQMLHALRVSLDDRTALLGNPLHLDPAVVSTDIAEFRQALAAGDLERAAALYQGPFLDGFYLSGMPEFEQWVTSERSRLELQYATAIEKLSTQAAARGDHPRTIEWIRALGGVTLVSQATARRLMRALAAAGDRDAALEFAGLYTARVRAELGAEPDPSVPALADQIRGTEVVPWQYDREPAESFAAVPVDHPPARVARHDRSRRASYGTAIVGGVVLLALLGGWAWLSRSKEPPLDRYVIAVMPFRVTAPDSSYNYMREGIIDLLNARLTGNGVPRAIDSRTLLVAWQRAARDRFELTEQESLMLARQLGAGRALLGSLVVTRGGSILTASLRDAASGREILPHRSEGSIGEIRLVDDLTRALLAHSAGQNDVRSTAISDSLEAIKEYLTGLRASRGNEWLDAYQHYSRAVEIDSTFALAALRLVELVFQAKGPRPPSPAVTDPIFRLASSLRERLSDRDQLNLRAQAAYYLHADFVSSSEAAERAAHAAPDDSNIWTFWGAALAYLGPIAVADWHRLAVAVLDSAISLDSSNTDALQMRLFLALHGGDPLAIGQYSRMHDAVGASGDDVDGWRWAAAQATRDGPSIDGLRSHFSEFSDRSVRRMAHLALVEGFPLIDVEAALRELLARPTRALVDRTGDLGWLFDVLAARGRAQAALALADSAMKVPNLRMQYAERLIRQAVLEPRVGYDHAAEKAARMLAAVPRLADNRSAYCLTHIWRATRDELSLTRRAIDTLRARAAHAAALYAIRVSRGGACPALLELQLIVSSQRAATPEVLERADSILGRGLYWDRVAPTANVLLARLQESQSDLDRALASYRRRPRGNGDYQMPIWPASLRGEGRLAATVGDTAGAVRAYTHYLTLRDKPDSGAMAREVAEVRAHLSQLRRVAVR